MLFVECTGTPYEIGHQHGTAARTEIERCISFYAGLFQTNCKQTWPQVHQHASKFERHAKETWPAFHEEMRGIADGAGRELLDIVALNVRTEINFGLFSDGCTALAWQTSNLQAPRSQYMPRSWLAQNWDWMTEQKQNLIITKITQANKPTIIQVTEAGIIGKIGFNSSGLGTLLNAIKVHGVDSTRLPVHFGLRMALESNSVDEAVSKLETHGMASSAHILIADSNISLGLEFTKSTFAHCVPDSAGRIVHANHLLLEHPGETDTVWLKDSLTRVCTMTDNANKLNEQPSWEDVSRLFEDEQNCPASICRIQTKETGSETLFNIVMDLKSKTAVVRLGRPTRVEETIELAL
ncbi:peptidase C45 acyl-coenzyme A:6-aminopenicillanic acid acyl-transferas-like protein [Dothidotthia symphoricarpi CBS 119687]|uniref:Peptidase C45 acyl-coenzyme A:6-aminopenicillanic acid acyl-transferas-like protein n=1 Tax=Dothidotthia symphoricarpi CBS 119687 TaxID=1392245 RepID=A0A6A6A6F5_9PLEO|nr:peptidase C45 acyl-coenzyme A:6-aminopenicillanic acid acyl-transferas-like protein [Dothidotthia symphoricarpi CBS 119687]KAF2126201.1 peptidase C45 acyl-coenzyme A:6-aminopenicillanic acid acyl-transferas-like protein [Dothidotthia symphoricarpi CBS 119687]